MLFHENETDQLRVGVNRYQYHYTINHGNIIDADVKILDNFSGAVSSLVHLTLKTSFLACFVHFRAEKTGPF